MKTRTNKTVKGKMILKNGIVINNSKSIEQAIELANNTINKPLVVIKCITYNQEDYIEQTLKGFVMQKTNFPFVAIVHDDASTDKTASVVCDYAKKFPDIIKPVLDDENRHRERTLSQVMDILIDAYSPKYVAICEGDDYWIDPLKLQKQVDYLEKHSECVMCHGDYVIVNGKKRKNPPHYDDEPYFGPDHKHTYTISTLTVVYRYATYKKIPCHFRSHNWLMGDFPLWIELSREGKFHFMPVVLGSYRILPNSASHSTDAEKIIKFWKSTNEIKQFYSVLYGYTYQEPSYKSLYSEIQHQCYRNRDKAQAKKYWEEAKVYNGISLKSSIFYFCNVYDQSWIVNLIYKFIS